MILLTNSLGCEFRNSFTQQINILYLRLYYSGTKHDTSPVSLITCTAERLPRKKLDFILLVFIFNLSRFHQSILFCVCYLFQMENFTSCFITVEKCGFDLQRMREEKTLCASNEYHMDGTRSSETNIYSSDAHLTVHDVFPLFSPKSLRISSLDP